MIIKDYNIVMLYDCTPFSYFCELDRVVDGDTIKMRRIDLGFGVSLHDKTVRIHGIDVPESRINLKKFPEREKEKELGLLAKERVDKYLMNSPVAITSYGYDKYGRILACVFCNAGSLSQLLIEDNLAVEYDGGKKTKVWT